MRFREFAPIRYLQTPVVSNAPAEPITSVRNIPVIPDEIKHRRWQQLKAAEIARSANQIQPTEIDMVKAQMMYADKQREAKKELERQKSEQYLTTKKRSLNRKLQRN